MEAKGNDVEVADRAIGALVFLVPLFDGIRYGELTISHSILATCVACQPSTHALPPRGTVS